MASSFVGYYVSLSCDNESTYEGEVGEIDAVRQLITLTHAHQLLPDGSTLKYPRITLTGNHVRNLKIIRERIQMASLEELAHDVNSKVKELALTEQDKNQAISARRTKSPKFIGEFPKSPTKKKKNGCFIDDASEIMTYPDFDFQENLAKFDKQAVFKEMIQNSSENLPGGIPDYDRKMKSQENVLESEPVSLRQIKVPVKHAGKEYSTEDGFIVPSITIALKTQLYAAAEKAGLSRQQLAENAGICTCQMVLQLLGGSLRINPKNNHQRPEVVVLAGAHSQGLQAVCTARHLANHTVKVVLYLPITDSLMQPQVDMYLKSGGKLITSFKDLPSRPVDMIIDATVGLESQKSPEWLPFAISWANQNKAPLLAVDPCLPQTKIEAPEIKWSIAMGLPLIKSPKAGRLYLGDVGIPRGIFSDVGIAYMSPFKDKYSVPLYES